MWLQLQEVAGHRNVELRGVLAAIFQPAMVSSVQSTRDKALGVLHHGDRNSEVPPSGYQLMELYVVCGGLHWLVDEVLTTLSLGTPAL